MDETSGSSSPEKKSYSGGIFSLRNIIIYLILAALIYGAIYFFFLNKNTNQAASTTTPAATTAPTDSAAMAEPLTITLQAQNDSNETGTATLVEENGKTRVTVTLANPPTDTPQPAHIHDGACPKPGEVAYPLTNVVNGQSVTVIEATMDALMEQMPLAINVHKSASQSSVYVSCGDLK